MEFTNDELVFMIQALTYTHPQTDSEISMKDDLLDSFEEQLREQRM